jgi:CRP/FNR family cyclic AMP-dependent transcriptional regulator
MALPDYFEFEDLVFGLGHDGSMCTTTLTLDRHTRLYNVGDTDDHVFLIESGQVKTFTVSRDGRECLLALECSGAVVGELCLLSSGRTEGASAMQTTRVRRMSAGELLRVLSRCGMLEDFVRHEALKVAQRQELITSFVTMNSEQRLAARILQLAMHQGKRRPDGIKIEERITHEEFASMVGTTRSRTGFFLKRFSEAGLVRRTPDAALLVEDEGLSRYLSSADSELPSVHAPT